MARFYVQIENYNRETKEMALANLIVEAEDRQDANRQGIWTMERYWELLGKPFNVYLTGEGPTLVYDWDDLVAFAESLKSQTL
jgi:hypothetical protein